MNGHSNIDTTQATEHLKNILNLNVEKIDPSSVITDSKLDTPSSNLSTTSSNLSTTNSKLSTPSSKLDTQMERSGSAINYGNENVFQQVELSGDDINVPIYGTDVTVYSSPLHGNPSLKIMIDNVVDYGWDHKYYVGRLLSVHLSMKYLAYSLKSPVSPCGFVRVMKLDSTNNILLRGFKGSVKDLAFAFSPTRLILGCIDEIGHLFVFEITDDGNKLNYEILMHIAKRHEAKPSIYNRIVWCPFVPDDIESEDMTMQLCTTHNELVEIWRVDNIVKEYGKEILYSGDLKKSSYLTITQHKEPITVAAFSPDGIALATASLDGNVKFFQLNIQENGNTPKYLHEWIPHNGKPLSSLFFLDNMKNSNPDVQFWKFAVTGCDNNQELKLWTCKTWVCLQTISFKPNQVDAAQPCLKADLDLSGRYIFLSDINRKVLYILRVKQETESGHTFICSLSEFAVKFSVLSLAVVNVTQQKAKSATIAKSSCDNDDDDDEEDDDDKDNDGDDESDELSGSLRKKSILDYVIKLYWIHTKSLQSCRIIYNVKTESPIPSVSSVSSSQDSFVYRDGLSDLIVDEQMNMNIIDGGDTPNKCISPDGINAVLTSPSSVAVTSLSSLHTNYQVCDDILLTPKDFTSPSHADLPSVNITNSFTLASVDEVCSNLESDKLKSEQGALPIQAVSPDINPCSRRKSSQHSSSSSPSREVAEILSPRQILNQDHESITPNEEKEDGILPNDKHPDTVICDSPPSKPFQSNEWPSAPPNPAKEYKAAASRSESDILLPQSAEKHEQSRHTLPSLEDGDMSTRMIGNDSYLQMPYLQRIEQSMEALNHKLTSISDVLHRQSQVNQYIQSELQELREQQKFMQNDIESFGSLDVNIPKKIEQLISANAASEYTRIESLCNKRENNEKQRIEQQSAVLSQSLLSVISPQLDKIVKQEMQNTVAPQISSYVDTLVVHLQESLLQKLNATDNVIKECVGRHLKSKTFGENVAQAVLTQLQQTVQIACRDTFQMNVIPAFDKTCKMLIGQMNDIFATGTTEYARLLERQMKSTCENFEASVSKLQDQLKRLSVVADGTFEKQRMNLEKKSAENANQNELLIMKIKQTVHEEVQKALKEQASSIISLSSRAATPASVVESVPIAPNPNVLLQLIKQGEINKAFHQALCGYDLELVILLCQSVSLDQVFGPSPCPLEQDVLLALINQLSGDLNEKTELKVKFIEDGVASLDINSDITKSNFGRVFTVLEQRIVAFMKRNPNHQLNRSFRRILLSSKSLLS